MEGIIVDLVRLRLINMSKKITIEFDENDAEEILEIIRQLLERTEENGEKRKTEED